MSWDVIIARSGAPWAAAAAWITSPHRGKRVLAIEQFTSPHDQGSSHGGSRIIRQAYWEGAEYIPLVSRAYELWRQLENDTHSDLLHITGAVVIGRRDGELVPRTVAAAERYAIPIDMLNAAELRRRFPAFVLQSEDAAVHEPGAGYLIPENCIRAHLQLASRAGADLRFEEKVLSWTAGESGVEVVTNQGTYRAGHLVIAAGPWANEALSGLFALRVTRQVMVWIDPRGGVTPVPAAKLPNLCNRGCSRRPARLRISCDRRTRRRREGSCPRERRGLQPGDGRPLDLRNPICAEPIDVVKLRIPALDGPVLRAKTCALHHDAGRAFCDRAAPPIQLLLN